MNDYMPSFMLYRGGICVWMLIFNGRHIDVLVNDRGPFHDNGMIDLSQGAAKELGKNGLTEVEVESLEN